MRRPNHRDEDPEEVEYEDPEESLDVDEDTIIASLQLARRALRKDLRDMAKQVHLREARYLVQLYYTVQGSRLRNDGRRRSLSKTEIPHFLLDLFGNSFAALEADLRVVLDYYTQVEPTGQCEYARSIVGIGPVLAAGLQAYCWPVVADQPGVAHLWSYAGLNPLAVWKPGTKRPWNAELRVLCFKIGEAFVKTKNNPRDIFGHLYTHRKLYEQYRNSLLHYQDQAEAQLARFNYGADTIARSWYERGMLPPGHIHARARRYAVKKFLSDWWAEARERMGLEVPPPYAITNLAHLGHTHIVRGEGWRDYPMFINGEQIAP